MSKELQAKLKREGGGSKWIKKFITYCMEMPHHIVIYS